MKRTYWCLLFISGFSLVECLFPKCEDVLKPEDGLANCPYCNSRRIVDECKDVCRKSGCGPKFGTDTPTPLIVTDSTISTTETASVTRVTTTSVKGKEKGKNRRVKLESDEKKQNVGKKSDTKENNVSEKTISRGNNDEGRSNLGTGTKCNDIEPCVELSAANVQFRNRCQGKGFEDKCSKYCRYNVTRNEIQSAFLRKECQLSQARGFLYAAANERDNTYCCTENHVLSADKPLCEPFCNPSSKNWPKKAELKYLRCLAMFNTILKCHWAACRAQ